MYAGTLPHREYMGRGLSVPVLDGLRRGGGSQLGHEDSHDVEQEDEINLREMRHSSVRLFIKTLQRLLMSNKRLVYVQELLGSTMKEPRPSNGSYRNN